MLNYNLLFNADSLTVNYTKFFCTHILNWTCTDMLNDTFISLTRLYSTLSHRTNAILNNNILENTR